MSDKKISALTSASTPLAGTEVLPIVQSGSTVKTSVTSLTADIPITPSSVKTSSSSDYSQFGQANGRVNFYATNSPSSGATTNQWRVSLRENVEGDFTLQHYNGTTWDVPFQIKPSTYEVVALLGTFSQGISGKGFTTAGAFSLGLGTNGGSSQALLDTSGNLTISNGNLIQGTAAKGINFTANAGAAGMTSQLLNWYEEGTWTPVVTSNVGTITTMGTVVGSYTRIGRQVTVMFDCTITTNGTGSSYIKVAGIPYASVTYVASGAGKEYAVTDKSLNLVLSAGSTTIAVFFYDGTYPGGNNYRLLGTLNYFV